MLDDLDYRLIAILRHNSRTPAAVLARELGVRDTQTNLLFNSLPTASPHPRAAGK